MSNAIEQWKKDRSIVAVERDLMNEALSKLATTDACRIRNRLPGRLIVGLDLTGSRDAGLKQARIATAAMFDTIRSLGKLAVKLAYYRGTDECRESEWYDDANVLCRSMLKLSCKAGNTQLARLLRLVVDQKEKVSGLVFIGDHCEEDGQGLIDLAVILGKKSVPIFIFHECDDHNPYSLAAVPVFERLAKESGGAYVEFKPDSGVVLHELLSTVAAFSSTGVQGLTCLAAPKTSEARKLQGKMRLMLGAGSHRER